MPFFVLGAAFVHPVRGRVRRRGTECRPPHFVLLGLMIQATDWKRLDAAIERVKGGYGLANVEIHTAWMIRRYSEQEVIPGFESLNREARTNAFQQDKGARHLGIDVTTSPVFVRPDDYRIPPLDLRSQALAPTPPC